MGQAWRWSHQRVRLFIDLLIAENMLEMAL
jgi:hypothetical protein